MRLFIILLFSISFQTSLALEIAYVKTDSPKDTMESFLSAMNDYRQGVSTNSYTKKQRINDAIRCFSEKSSTIISSQREKELSAIFLKEIIDRTLLIDLSKIPETTENIRWRLKNTEIVLKKEKEGDREGEWLITEQSWKSAHSFYERVKNFPYIDGSGQGALYSQPWMEDYLPQWSKDETLKIKNWQWLGIFVGLFLSLLIRILVIFTLNLYLKLIPQTRYNWRTRLFKEITNPMALFSATLFAYSWFFYLNLEGFVFGFINGLIFIVFGFALTWVAYKSTHVLSLYFKEKASQTESTLDDQIIPFIEKTFKLMIVMFGILIVLQNMGFNVFSLLAGLGLGGLAFALAAKDTAANLFGSIMILVDRPFKIGDWIVVDSVEGKVEEVGFRSTRIRTFYNSLITVPNANMANAQIDNMGLRQYRRTKTTLDVSYNTSSENLEKFIQSIREIILEHPISRKDLFHVYFSGYGESSLQIMLYFFLITEDWSEELKERQNIFLKIFNLAEELKVEFAYPTRTLYLKKEGDSDLESPL